MTAIFKREFASHFHNVRGYATLSVLIFLSGILVVYYGFIYESPSIIYVLSDLMPVYALVFPILTFKTLSEERAKGRERLLYSLPLSSFEVVAGKYLAVLAINAIPMALLAFVPFIYNYLGEVNLGASYLSLLAFFAFVASLSAVGIFFSAVIDKSAFILSAGYGYAVFMYLLQVVSLFVKKQHMLFGILPRLLSFVGIFNRFEPYVYGVFDISSLIYYLSISVFFVYLSVRSFEKRRLGGERI